MLHLRRAAGLTQIAHRHARRANTIKAVCAYGLRATHAPVGGRNSAVAIAATAALPHRRTLTHSTAALTVGATDANKARLPSSYQPLVSQQDRWNRLRTLTSSLLTDAVSPGGLNSGSTSEWVHLPNLNEQPSSHHNLQHDTRVASQSDASQQHDDDDDVTLTSYLISKQSIDSSHHSQPTLLTHATKNLWKKLATWDRIQQIKTIQREKEQVIDASSSENGVRHSSSFADAADDDFSAPPSIGWTTRGLFLDGPNGVSKSTTLYTLACMARSQNWLVVHMNDADRWVGELSEGAATRMFVQAIYEACASTILPSTKEWSTPHSLLQMPLSPELDYTSTLIEQGINTFGELLTLSLELSDGLEETELSIECIMDQLFHIQTVPVLICVDGFDALTQKCLQPPTVTSEEEDASGSSSDLIAPIATSPFSWLNYHRAPNFRGGFLLTGESFALVQQSHPELMERISTRSLEDQDEDDMDEEEEEEAKKKKSSNLFQAQQVDPIHVVPLPLLTPSLSREYLLRRLSRDTPDSFLLKDSHCDNIAFWTDLHHRLHSGHFGMINLLLSSVLNVSTTRLTLNEIRTKFQHLLLQHRTSLYEDYVGSSEMLQQNLINFFVQHLSQGFYRDIVRNDHRRVLGGYGERTNIARDFNLIPINMNESRCQLEWIKRYRMKMKNDLDSSTYRRILLESASYLILTAPTPFEQLSKSELTLTQHSKVEGFLQVCMMGMMLKQKIVSQDGTKVRPLEITSVQHWCPSTDPAILSLEELEDSSLHAHWTIPTASASSPSSNEADPSVSSPYLTRLVHVSAPRAEDGGVRMLTLFVSNLDPSLATLLFLEPTRPITGLMHTLYLHYLSDILKNVEVCIGPNFEVRAKANDGRSGATHTDTQNIDDVREMRKIV